MDDIVGFYTSKRMLLTEKNLHIMRDIADISYIFYPEKIMHHLSRREDLRSICDIRRLWFIRIILFSINSFSDSIKEILISISIIIHHTNMCIFSDIFIEIIEALGNSILRDIETLRFCERSRSG